MLFRGAVVFDGSSPSLLDADVLARDEAPESVSGAVVARGLRVIVARH